MTSLVPAADVDAPFAWALYEETMKPLAVALGSWAEADERAVVLRAFADGEAELVMTDGRRVGWVHVRTTPQSVELWQLFIVAGQRRRGVGTQVLRLVQARGRSQGVPVLLAVLRNNPARHLYAREGFSVHAEGPHHLFLWWSPGLR